MDKGNVIDFKPRRFTDVWECECGGQSFYLLETMRVECKSCGRLSHSLFLTTQPNDNRED